jgi:hypothetical protein
MKKDKLKTSHTGGEWEVNKASDPVFSIDSKKLGKSIAICANPFLDPSVNEANATLIAAAPDMLEAITTTKEFFDSMPKGQFGKISCDIGLMNDMFLQIGNVLSKIKK